jgi:hypothetical protein
MIKDCSETVRRYVRIRSLVESGNTFGAKKGQGMTDEQVSY